MACDPKTLAREASCFFCLPPGYYYPVKLAILARWLKILSPGADTSVAALMRDASCFACPPNAQLGPMRLALICEATSGPAPPPVPPVPLDFTIDLSSVAGNTVLIWTDAGGATTIEIWKSVNGGAYALYDTVGGAVTTYTDVAAMGALDYWEYKIRAVSGAGNSAFTTPAGAANGILDAISVNISFPNLIISYDTVDISGNVGLLTASFPRLAIINGAFFFFSDFALQSLDCSSLGTCTVMQGFDCSSLPALNFPALGITGEILLQNCTSAVGSNFNSLAVVGVDFLISNCANLGPLSFPSLTSVGGNFDLSINGSMTSLSCPSLANVGTSITLSNTGIVTVDFTSLASLGGDFLLDNCASLTDFSAPNLPSVPGSFSFANDSTLGSLTVASLASVGTDFLITNCGAITSLDFTSLGSVGNDFKFDLSFGAANINVSLPTLTQVIGALSFLGCAANLQNVSAPVLNLVGSVDLSNCSGLLTVDFTSIASVTGGDLNFSSDVALTALSLPNVPNLPANMRCNDCTSLVSVSIPNVIFLDGTLVTFDNCALSAASVNHILAIGVGSGTGSTDYELANGTNAAPSGAGIADKATLLLAGNTVNTN